MHREKRNAQQKQRMLDTEFKHLDIDQILHKLMNKAKYPDFRDTRYCLVFWARPPQAIKDLILKIQTELKTVAPSMSFANPRWLTYNGRPMDDAA